MAEDVWGRITATWEDVTCVSGADLIEASATHERPSLPDGDVEWGCGSGVIIRRAGGRLMVGTDMNAAFARAVGHD
jgi:hypothetical protein